MIQHGPAVKTARVYDTPTRGEATRILVDRVWPRGLSRENAHVGQWCKGVAPSTELRKWYAVTLVTATKAIEISQAAVLADVLRGAS